MKLKKIIIGLLCTTLLLSQAAVFAAFPDVDGDKTVLWAKPYIDEMSELGYIKGYEDGTFKPNKTISKVESLVLLSRMIGVNHSEYADTLKYALSEYKTAIEKYSAEYEKEIAFLLYRGVLKENELANYISISNRSVPLQRYEAAILLTKLLGDEAEVQSNTFVSSSYADTLEIPDSARAYVEYVKEKEIMQGMGNDANGNPVFSPKTGVTRSQMAKMLCSLIDILDKSSKEGVIEEINQIEDYISIDINGSTKKVNITDATMVKLSGVNANFTDLSEGMTVKVSYLHGKASLIENIVTVKDTTVKGIVASIREGNEASTITIADSENTQIKETYTVADSCKAIVNGAIDILSKIKVNNYVELTIEDGLVTRIEVINKSETAFGFLKGIDAKDGETVITITDNKGNETDYYLSSNNVNVTRNSLSSSISELITGDSVSFKLTYGKVHTIVAESSTANSTGELEYIKHTVNGTYIAIKLNGKTTEYKVNKSAAVLIDSSESNVYELRPGSDIKIKLESSEVIKIETSSTIAASQIIGKVKSVNATYGLIIVESNGKEYNVFTNTNTKIIDSATGNVIRIKNLEKESVINITGSNTSGVYEATVIVVQ